MVFDGAGLVIIGDVVGSRASERSAAWLRSLRDELDATYGDDRLAPFEFTQGDELQGLLRPSADPFEAVVRAGLRADRMPMRWVIAFGRIDPGSGPATQRSGPAFVAARELVAVGRRQRVPLVARTGDALSDELLDGVAPVLGRIVDELTDRQRAVARLILVDGLRQAEAATRLGIKPPTVSVAAERAWVREIAGLRAACAGIVRLGIERAGAT
jgi:hypothetical protein